MIFAIFVTRVVLTVALLLVVWFNSHWSVALSVTLLWLWSEAVSARLHK